MRKCWVWKARRTLRQGPRSEVGEGEVDARVSLSVGSEGEVDARVGHGVGSEG